MAAATPTRNALGTDREFDQVYPRELRLVSSEHWTPVKVAIRAAQLFARAGARHIVDVGCGPGKLCIIGALTTRARFTGIEQREDLVQAARTAAWRMAAQHVRFVVGNVVDVDLGRFDGIYLFNPFYEQICTTVLGIDDAIRLSPTLFHSYVDATTDKLARARLGTAVVTYHGFGGVMPRGYRRVHEERAGNDRLVLWVKHRAGRS